MYSSPSFDCSLPLVNLSGLGLSDHPQLEQRSFKMFLALIMVSARLSSCSLVLVEGLGVEYLAWYFSTTVLEVNCMRRESPFVMIIYIPYDS